MNQKRYKKILVIKQGSLGDIVFALPAMYSIRIYFEHSKVALLTESKFVNFLKKSKYFDRFLIDNRKGLLKTVFVILRIFHNDYNLFENEKDLQNFLKNKVVDEKLTTEEYKSLKILELSLPISLEISVCILQTLNNLLYMMPPGAERAYRENRENMEYREYRGNREYREYR